MPKQILVLSSPVVPSNHYKNIFGGVDQIKAGLFVDNFERKLQYSSRPLQESQVMFSGGKQVAFEAFLTILVVVILPSLIGMLSVPCYVYQANTKLDKTLGSDNYYVDGNYCDEKCTRSQLTKLPTSAVDITIIMPAFNEEERLPVALDATIQHMNAYSAEQQLSYEILVVDDYSTDKTADLVLEYSRNGSMGLALPSASKDSEAPKQTCENAEQDCGGLNSSNSGSDSGSCSLQFYDVRLLKLKRNRGKGGAIKKGVLVSRGNHILFADADGATDITYIGKLYSRLLSIQKTDAKLGGDVGMVVGSRAHLERDSIAVRKWYRTLLMKGFHFLVKILCTDSVKDTQCGFKMFTKQSAKVLFTNLHLEGWVFDTEIIYLAEKLNMPLAEEAVAWQEVDGSKLIRNKMDVVVNSVLMARDMLCMQIAYYMGLWGVSSWQ